ncbi:bifunctional oligoribonuclease/PAP phosphatase NrnA [Halomarina halobia]|uniref:Bifunctional oligoribonuclease/PAP phosphatase NrnA n=1 Tax=Halomarina halobia TaxID=3033386 RepID=A0ABD6A928_9EURY|nr:bifunctional oligoribonuclease/PAP phosphatase NrnA [Halomarina sp. PSR21]
MTESSHPQTVANEGTSSNRADGTSDDVGALFDLLESHDSLAVVCHNNPDPDCLGSALALEAIAEACDVGRVDILYAGEITHQQNRAMVNLLDIDAVQYAHDRLASTELVAFVDHSIPGVNNAVPPDYVPDIVIDHHPMEGVAGTFVDRREEVGATASILAQYLRVTDVDVEERVATGLLFGIRRETLGFMRGVTEAEYDAAEFLHPFADVDLLRRLSDSLFTPATLDSIAEATRNRVVRGSALVSNVGRTAERDALPQAADHLLNLEGITTTVVFGVVGDTVHISARSRDSRVDIGAVMRRTFDDVGNAGGHKDMAGGTLPLGLFGILADESDELCSLVGETITERVFDSLA